MTETGATGCCNPRDGPKKVGSIGRPIAAGRAKDCRRPGQGGTPGPAGGDHPAHSGHDEGLLEETGGDGGDPEGRLGAHR